MCDRYVVPSTTGDLLSVFDASGDNAAVWKPSYSVTPTDPAPIVREWIHNETVNRDVDLATWGLKPGWAKPGGPAPINARLESAAGLYAARQEDDGWKISFRIITRAARNASGEDPRHGRDSLDA